MVAAMPAAAVAAETLWCQLAAATALPTNKVLRVMLGTKSLMCASFLLY